MGDHWVFGRTIRNKIPLSRTKITWFYSLFKLVPVTPKSLRKRATVRIQFKNIRSKYQTVITMYCVLNITTLRIFRLVFQYLCLIRKNQVFGESEKFVLSPPHRLFFSTFQIGGIKPGWLGFVLRPSIHRLSFSRGRWRQRPESLNTFWICSICE